MADIPELKAYITHLPNGNELRSITAREHADTTYLMNSICARFYYARAHAHIAYHEGLLKFSRVSVWL